MRRPRRLSCQPNAFDGVKPAKGDRQNAALGFVLSWNSIGDRPRESAKRAANTDRLMPASYYAATASARGSNASASISSADFTG